MPERSPDTTSIDAQLRRLGIDPKDTDLLPVINPNTVRPESWHLQREGTVWHGVLGRPQTMRYSHGQPRAISKIVINDTPVAIQRTLSGREKIGTSTTMSMSHTLEAEFFDVMKETVTSAFDIPWDSEREYVQDVEVTIPVGKMMWLELIPSLRTVEGEFLYVYSLSGLVIVDWSGRFSGSVTAPGAAGEPADIIQVKEAPAPANLVESLSASMDPHDGGIELPAELAAVIIGGAEARTVEIPRQGLPITVS